MCPILFKTRLNSLLSLMRVFVYMTQKKCFGHMQYDKESFQPNHYRIVMTGSVFNYRSEVQFCVGFVYLHQQSVGRFD